MSLDNYGLENRASMHFLRTNDAPIQDVYCSHCGRYLMRLNYKLIALTNSAGVTLQEANRIPALVIEWRCRNCKTIWSLQF